MATDVLVLGPFVFTDFSVPDRLPLGGRQHHMVHKMPGGDRVIDCLGPDDADRAWSGTLWGNRAQGDALMLDALRRAGKPLSYSNGFEARTVVITEFQARVQKPTCIEYSICVTPSDNPGGSSGGGANVGALVVADLVS